MNYEWFENHNKHICVKCGFTMKTVAFSEKIAKEMKHIIESMDR